MNIVFRFLLLSAKVKIKKNVLIFLEKEHILFFLIRRNIQNNTMMFSAGKTKKEIHVSEEPSV